MSWGPRPGDRGWLSLSFAIFVVLIWVSLFMAPNSSPRAFEEVSLPLRRFFFLFEGPFLLSGSFVTFFGGCA